MQHTMTINYTYALLRCLMALEMAIVCQIIALQLTLEESILLYYRSVMWNPCRMKCWERFAVHEICCPRKTHSYYNFFFTSHLAYNAQGDYARTVELAPSGLDANSFPRQSWSRGGGIATEYKSTFGSNIAFNANLDLTHSSFEVVQASITQQHNSQIFLCLYRPPPNRQNNLTDSMFTEQLPDCLIMQSQPERLGCQLSPPTILREYCYNEYCVCITKATSQDLFVFWWSAYTPWQSITITNQTDFDYSSSS